MLFHYLTVDYSNFINQYGLRNVNIYIVISFHLESKRQSIYRGGRGLVLGIREYHLKLLALGSQMIKELTF